MQKHRFTYIQRFAVWKFHGQQCWWCGEPLRVQESTIDHVLPESLISKPNELKKILAEYGLPESFQINDYNNWVPCHDSCNRSKSTTVFKPVPMILSALDRLAKNTEKVKAIEDQTKLNKKKDFALSKLMAAIETGLISKEEITAALADSELQSDEDIQILAEEYNLRVDPNRWKVIREQNGLVTVTDGRWAGITPICEKPDPSWICPTCNFHGPWNGIRCMSCGQISDGD
jgi:5-methylcytosine-specific restriction endonuclease McrA